MNFLSGILIGLENAAAGAAEAGAAAAGTEEVAAAGGGDLLGMLLPMVLMIGVFYFLMIRPQRKKDKKVKNMLANLKVGDRICTIGGVYGTITAIKDDTVEMSVGRDNVKLIFARWSIRSVEEIAVENDSEVLN